MNINKHIMTTDEIREVPVPEFVGYYARSDGTIRLPNGNIQAGSTSKTCIHRRVWAKKHYWRRSYAQLVHRLIALAFVHNPLPHVFTVVDHIDRNPWNNKPENLRWVTTQMNSLNNSALGCFFSEDTGKWHARVTVSGKVNIFGEYETKEIATQEAKTYREEAIRRLYKKHLDEAEEARTSVFRGRSADVPITS